MPATVGNERCRGKRKRPIVVTVGGTGYGRTVTRRTSTALRSVPSAAGRLNQL